MRLPPDGDCRRQFFIWPADRRSDYRSRCRLRISPAPLPARRDCWSGCAARRHKLRLIVASSAAVYGADHGGPIAENAGLVPMSPYGQHKLMMEQLCRSYATTFGIRSTVARLFSVYGPRLRKQLLWDICSRLQQDGRTLDLGGTGAEVRDWTDVRDVARLLACIAEQPQQEAFRVINGGSRSRHDRRRNRTDDREALGRRCRCALFRHCPCRRPFQPGGGCHGSPSPAVRLAGSDRTRAWSTM